MAGEILKDPQADFVLLYEINKFYGSFQIYPLS